jgi:hypothetical protein
MYSIAYIIGTGGGVVTDLAVVRVRHRFREERQVRGGSGLAASEQRYRRGSASIAAAQRSRGRSVSIAAEHRPTYVGSDGTAPEPESSAGCIRQGVTGAAAGHERLRASVDEMVRAVDQVDLDGLDDATLDELLRTVQRGYDRLAALRCLAAGARETRALRAAGPGREQRALRDTRQALREELQLTPSEAKKLGETGRRVGQAPRAQRSLRRGRLRPEHAAIITDTLRWLDGAAREAVEEQLVEAAGRCDPVALGRLARRLLAEADQGAAMEAVNRRHARRSTKLVEQPDGMTDLYARLSGLEAELAHTTLHAFRRPDAAGEHRTPEQATADALVDIFNAALRSRQAPTQHGERPHVTITIAQQDLERSAGVGEGVFTGPMPAREIQRLVRDAKLTWVVVDPVGVPQNVSEGRNVVNSALWRALLVRDGGCRWPGCDAPPSWCDIAHAEVPDRDGGPRVLSNVALLCRRHHRQVDLGRWTMRIRGPDVVFDPPAGSSHERIVSSR